MGSYDRASGDAPNVEQLGREVNNALSALRDAVESKNSETLYNVRRVLDQYEEHVAQKRVKDFMPERKRREAVALASAMGMPINPDGSIDYAETLAMRDTPEFKSWVAWYSDNKVREVRTKLWSPHDLDHKVLRTDSEPSGGYLLPAIMDASIRKNIIEVSPVRRHARVRLAHSKSMEIPRRLAVPIAQFEGEAESAPTAQSTYGSETVTVYRQTVNIPATLDMMLSAAFDIELEIASDVGELFAQGEGLNFVKGNGRKGPQGFMGDTRVVSQDTASSGIMTWDDFATLSGQ